MELEHAILETRDGSTEAFGHIYDHFSERLYRFIYIKVHDKESAEDILQEVFVKAWQGLPGFTPHTGKFSAWLYRIAANSTNDYFRKKYRRPETVELLETIEVASTEDAGQDLQKSMERDLIKQALARLPAQYTEVIELRFIQDFTLDETARILKKSNISVRVLQHRALKKLQEVVRQGPLHGYSS